ncbi:MAG TPA: CpsD/CapB family tyrosine-protein kinase, partial [Geminicoccaceae bacterium]
AFLALLAEALRNGFRSGEEIEAELGVPTLGLVPQTRRPVEAALRQPRAAFTESVRAMYVALAADPGAAASGLNGGRVLAVTSALPGEGKTTIATALACVLAADGHDVLLVDADLRRPSAHRALGLSAARGLTDVLSGDADLDAMLLGEPGSRLRVLPAGTRQASPVGLLASAEAAGLIAELRRRFDVVILDTPPLLPVADARVLARLADEVVLVLRWGRTRRSAARLALRHLVESGATVAGVLISRVDPRRHATYGYGDAAAYSGASLKYYAAA